MAEINWEARLKKWEDGINVATATKEDLAEYLDTKMHQYSVEKFADDLLWTALQEEFKGFTLEHINKIS